MLCTCDGVVVCMLSEGKVIRTDKISDTVCRQATECGKRERFIVHCYNVRKTPNNSDPTIPSENKGLVNISSPKFKCQNVASRTAWCMHAYVHSKNKNKKGHKSALSIKQHLPSRSARREPRAAAWPLLGPLRRFRHCDTQKMQKCQHHQTFTHTRDEFSKVEGRRRQKCKPRTSDVARGTCRQASHRGGCAVVPCEQFGGVPNNFPKNKNSQSLRNNDTHQPGSTEWLPHTLRRTSSDNFFMYESSSRTASTMSCKPSCLSCSDSRCSVSSSSLASSFSSLSASRAAVYTTQKRRYTPCWVDKHTRTPIRCKAAANVDGDYERTRSIADPYANDEALVIKLRPAAASRRLS